MLNPAGGARATPGFSGETRFAAVGWTLLPAPDMSSGMTIDSRRFAKKLFKAGIEAADPLRAVARALDKAPLAPVSERLLLLAIGKAAPGMAEVAQARLRPDKTLVITTADNALHLPGATVMAAAHPVPDAESLLAGEAAERLLASAGARDHVVVLISGGASALVCTPVPGISLEDKARVTRLLLKSGLAIEEMNLVRQHLSRLKGGGMLRVAAPARVSGLILSDVVSDDLRLVASGPTSAPAGTCRDARAALWGARIWQALPEPVREHLSQACDEQAPPLPGADNRLIGSNRQSVLAMAEMAPGALVPAEPLVGDVASAAARICAGNGRGIRLFGGETTVQVKGTGLGGRNQELALRVALEAEKRDWPAGWVFLSGGTDGRDGPTDAAGAIVDDGTLRRMRAAGVDPKAALVNNDSYRALSASNDLLITGETGTNVADLQVLIR